MENIIVVVRSTSIIAIYRFISLLRTTRLARHSLSLSNYQVLYQQRQSDEVLRDRIDVTTSHNCDS